MANYICTIYEEKITLHLYPTIDQCYKGIEPLEKMVRCWIYMTFVYGNNSERKKEEELIIYVS